MRVKILKERQILKDLKIEEGKVYEILAVIGDSYKIALPMKQKNKTKHVLVNEDEGVLVD